MTDRIAAWMRALRVEQWTKNGVVMLAWFFSVADSSQREIVRGWESSREKDGVRRGRLLALFPMRWVPSIDRNWAKFWTFYETEANPVCTYHSLLWGLIRWRTVND